MNLIECFYLIEGTGTVTISSESEDDDLELGVIEDFSDHEEFEVDMVENLREDNEEK